MGPMRAMSAELLEGQRKALQLEKAAAEAAAAAAGNGNGNAGADKDETPLADLPGEGGPKGETGAGGEEEKGGDLSVEFEKGQEASAEEGGGEEDRDGKGSAGYVEFLPVEWFQQVR